MPKSDIGAPASRPISRPRDVFSAMRDEMERMLERAEHGWPRWPALFKRDGESMVPSSTCARTPMRHGRGRAAGVEEKDVTVTLANGVLTIKGEKRSEKEERATATIWPSAASAASSAPSVSPTRSTRPRSRPSSTRGVLKVTAAKKPEAVKAERRIEIKRS